MDNQNQAYLNPEAVYTEAYFIEKFQAIPFENWATEEYENNGCFCALGHCGETSASVTDESSCLRSLINMKLIKVGLYELTVAHINDGELNTDRLGATPKERILTILQATPEEIGRMMLCRL